MVEWCTVFLSTSPFFDTQDEYPMLLQIVAPTTASDRSVDTTSKLHQAHERHMLVPYPRSDVALI